MENAMEVYEVTNFESLNPNCRIVNENSEASTFSQNGKICKISTE